MAASFSYAQAAKGQSASGPSTKSSSTVPSGAATPASASATTETTAGAASAENGEHSPQDIAEGNVQVDAVNPQNQEQARAGAKTAHALVRNTDTTSSVDTDSVNDSVASKDTKSDTKASSVDVQTASQDAAAEKEQAADKAIPKPVYQDAKPPAVNIWAQRAAELKAKQPGPSTQPPAQLKSHNSAPSVEVAPSASDRSKYDARRKSDQIAARDAKRGDYNARPREDYRGAKPRRDNRAEDPPAFTKRTPPKPRETAHSEASAPTTNGPVAWPKPEDARDEDKKRQDDKDKNVSVASRPHGKPEWRHMPYTPTAVFETRLEGRAAPKVGKGTAKPGPPLSIRAAPNGIPMESQSSPLQPALPNGDNNSPLSANARSDRDVMPPPPAPQTSEIISHSRDSDNAKSEHNLSKSQTIPSANSAGNEPQNGDQHKSVAYTKALPSPLDATKTFEPATNGYSSKRTSVHIPLDNFQHGHQHSDSNPFSPRSAHTERRSEPHIYESPRENGSYRESKRGGRKGPGRGSFTGGHFGSPTPYNNGFQDFGAPPFTGAPSPNFYGGRGSGRGGYRNQGMRSQSIPIDTSYGRQVPGYGYQIPPSFIPDFYGPVPFSAGPYPGAPNAERELLVAQVLQQVEYYFSIDNLLKDIFLRKHMDSQGWIHLSVVASFNRMKQLTLDYDILKSACLMSAEIEIRVGEDGKERLRKVREWEQWVLPLEDRDISARSQGPTTLRQVSPIRIVAHEQQPMFSPTSPMPPVSAGRVQEHSFDIRDAASAPFFPGGYHSGFDGASHNEESRGRPVRPSHRENGAIAPTVNGFEHNAAQNDSEPDRFPSSRIDGLTVLVRKSDAIAGRPAPHNAGSRTFSNGSIDSRNILEEMSRTDNIASSQVNGTSNHVSHDRNSSVGSTNGDVNDFSLFWVKDKEKPIDIGALPSDTTHELYTILHDRALSQRSAASTGNCPYDLDVLYQFWSHFLVRNFNSRMYHEFKTLAHEDATQRQNNAGLKNLINYYNGALSSQVSIRDSIVQDFADLIKNESGKGQGSALAKVKESWQNGNMNLKNRKKLSDLLDDRLKSEFNS